MVPYKIKSLKAPKWLSCNRINTVAMPTALAVTLLIQYSCDCSNLIQQKSAWKHMEEDGDTYVTQTQFWSFTFSISQIVHLKQDVCVPAVWPISLIYMTQGTKDISYQLLTKPLGFLLLTMWFRHRFYSLWELVTTVWAFASESSLKIPLP